MRLLITTVPFVILLLVSGSSFADTSNESTSSLSESEKKILEKGRIDQDRRLAGYAVGYVIGLGIGHAITKQYEETGWIFTTGEVASLGAMIYGAVERTRSGGNDALGNTFLAIGTVSFVGFRIWEIVDLAYRPHNHNEEYDRIQEKLKRSDSSWKVMPVIGRNEFGLTTEMRF